LAYFVYLVTLMAYQNNIQNSYTYLDRVWRVTFGIGAFPAFIAFFLRAFIPESPRYTIDVNGNIDKGFDDTSKLVYINEGDYAQSMFGENSNLGAQYDLHVRQNSPSDFRKTFSVARNMKNLFAVSYSWFVSDFVWFGLTMNQTSMLTILQYITPPTNSLGYTDLTNIYDPFFKTAVLNIVIVLFGIIPGYILSILLIEKIGRRNLQFIGFAVSSCILCLFAAFWSSLYENQAGFIAISILLNIFLQFGPNSTTSIIPAELFPTRWRSTAYGIASASGKVGAILSVQFMGPAMSNSMSIVLWIFGIVLATGLVSTALLRETKGVDLDELSGETGEDVFLSAQTISLSRKKTAKSGEDIEVVSLTSLSPDGITFPVDNHAVEYNKDSLNLRTPVEPIEIK
jgi:MFS transporter, PHS family, inorganic phosphate transporter